MSSGSRASTTSPSSKPSSASVTSCTCPAGTNRAPARCGRIRTSHGQARGRRGEHRPGDDEHDHRLVRSPHRGIAGPAHHRPGANGLPRSRTRLPSRERATSRPVADRRHRRLGRPRPNRDRDGRSGRWAPRPGRAAEHDGGGDPIDLQYAEHIEEIAADDPPTIDDSGTTPAALREVAERLSTSPRVIIWAGEASVTSQQPMLWRTFQNGCKPRS